MTWQEIYNKHKDSELMKEFEDYVITLRTAHPQKTIKDIWGYLICFAETKDIALEIMREFFPTRKSTFTAMHTERIDNESITNTEYKKTPEQAMFWCASQFFKLGEDNEV